MSKELILIVGASGQIGSEMVRLLKADGHQVRSTTSKVPKNADSVQVNLITGEGIREAFEGVTRAFIMSPPPIADQYSVFAPLIQESKRRGLKKVVLLSAWGTNAIETSPLRKAEIELEKSGINYNIVRPNWFMQNFSTFWVQGIKEHGKIFLPAGNSKTSYISTLDIAAVSAKLLATDLFNNKSFELSGPESLDHDQIAKEISSITNRQIEYVEISPEDLKKALLGAGLPLDYSEFLILILGFLKAGYNSGLNNNVQEILGRSPQTFAQYVKANVHTF